MATDISEEEVRRAIADMKHPEIDRTLVELGMVRDVAVEDNRVMLTMVLPFPGIPIKDLLVQSLREAVARPGVEVEVKLADMTQKERDTFLLMVQQGWIG
jgi:ATP-binding protein involved in chromosome partitioning